MRLGDRDSGSGRFIQARSSARSRWTRSGHDCWASLPRPRHKGGSPSLLVPYPRPAAHLKRGESLMHSSNSTVMAAASDAHWTEDHDASSGIPGR